MEKKVLTEQDLVIGNKYVPHSKSIGNRLHESTSWDKGKQQGFLYYNGYDGEQHYFAEIQGDDVGDFFLPSDMTPYIEPEKESDVIKETLSQYAERIKDNLISNYGNGSTTDGDIVSLIVLGANWQKEQDRELISELLNVAIELDKHYNGLFYQKNLTENGLQYRTELKKLIEKATQYLNK